MEQFKDFQNIHAMLSRYINQICVVGDRRNYLTALITLDPETTAAYAQENGTTFSSMDDLCEHPEIVKLIETEIAERNRTLASFETIKKFAIVPEFTIENGMLTPTLKLKKNIALEQYKARIDAMYG